MSQLQGPPPTITSVQSLNNALYITWDSDPYNSASDATLLIINITTNNMASILLENAQIMEEEYTVTDLVNGNDYAVLFSLLDLSGNTHNSNTLNGIPSDVPQPPTIVSYLLQGPTFTSVSIVATLGDNGGSDISKLVFRILKEGATITSQAFDISQDNTYSIVGLELGSDYIISCQALNSAGYSNVSNTISFANSDVPGTPVLGVIQSGYNSSATLLISGNNVSTAPITSFFVYNYIGNNTYSQIATLTPVAPLSGAYSVSLPLTPLANGTPYSLSIKAESINGLSLHSNVSTVVPALKLQFTGAVVTFPSASSINVAWTSNNATYLSSGLTTLGFTGPNIPLDASINVSNVAGAQNATYTLPTGTTLSVGSSYSVTINGYCVVPQNVYPSKWVQPTLTEYQYPAVQVGASGVYATEPSAVSNITYITDIDPSGGIIQFSWNPAAGNGSSVSSYSCQLYTVANSTRTPLESPIVTSDTNCLFKELDTNLFYAIGITATNSVGDGPVTYYPANPNFGIQITASVDPVTNLSGYQTSYDAGVFSGKLTWNYSGPGTGYTNAVFKIYSVLNNVQTLLGNVAYVSGTPVYNFDLDLGNTPNVTKLFVVYVTALSGVQSSLSVGVYKSITTGLAPIISDVSVTQITPGGNWQLSFKVTNNTSSPMIQNSIVSLVMPNPVESIQTINPIYNGYDTTLVPLNGSFVYQYELSYAAISDDYVLITACNGFGATLREINWGA